MKTNWHFYDYVRRSSTDFEFLTNKMEHEYQETYKIWHFNLKRCSREREMNCFSCTSNNCKINSLLQSMIIYSIYAYISVCMNSFKLSTQVLWYCIHKNRQQTISHTMEFSKFSGRNSKLRLWYREKIINVES